MREEGGGLGVKGWGGKGQGKRGRKGGTRTGPTKLGRGWKFKWYYILDKCKLDLNKWPIDRQQTHISFSNFCWENEHERKSIEEWLERRRFTWNESALAELSGFEKFRKRKRNDWKRELAEEEDEHSLSNHLLLRKREEEFKKRNDWKRVLAEEEDEHSLSSHLLLRKREEEKERESKRERERDREICRFS